MMTVVVWSLLVIGLMMLVSAGVILAIRYEDPDTKTTRLVRAKLAAQPRFSDVHVSVKRGMARLTGRTATANDKWDARVAAFMSGAKLAACFVDIVSDEVDMMSGAGERATAWDLVTGHTPMAP